MSLMLLSSSVLVFLRPSFLQCCSNTNGVLGHQILMPHAPNKSLDASGISELLIDNLAVTWLSPRRVNSNVMLLLLSGQIAAFIPGVFSFVIVALLLVALMKVDSIKQNRILYVVLVIVALFFVFAGVFLLYASEFWYVVTSSNLFSDYVAT